MEVNVLDATGDRIFAGEELTKEAVRFISLTRAHFRRALLLSLMRNYRRATMMISLYTMRKCSRSSPQPTHARADGNSSQSNFPSEATLTVDLKRGSWREYEGVCRIKTHVEYMAISRSTNAKAIFISLREDMAIISSGKNILIMTVNFPSQSR